MNAARLLLVALHWLGRFPLSGVRAERTNTPPIEASSMQRNERAVRTPEQNFRDGFGARFEAARSTTANRVGDFPSSHTLFGKLTDNVIVGRLWT